MEITKIIEKLDEIAPPSLACEWDNVGLLVGDAGKNVKRILVTLDITDEVVNQAIAEKADLIISHHPIIFKSLNHVSTGDFIGKRILKLAENKIAVYSMHTNFDVTIMAQYACEMLEITNAGVLETTAEINGIKVGLGRCGVLKKQITLEKLAERVKEKFDLKNVIVYGNMSDKIDIVAVCPGAGKDSVEHAVRCGAQVLITGDIGHHTGIDSVSRGLNIIDASHYGLEKIFVDFIMRYFEKAKGITLIKSVQEEPFKIL